MFHTGIRRRGLSFLIAYHNTTDAHHAAAARSMVQLSAGPWGPLLLLEYVFVEVVTVLLARRGHAVAARVGRALLDAREIDFIPGSELFADALVVFYGQKSGNLSFTDAAIVAAAKARGWGHVATFDRDFRDIPGVTVLPE